MAPRPLNFGPFLRGVHAEVDPYTQPKGSIPRASNLVLKSRGALATCDGSGIINAFDGIVQTGAKGRFSAAILFEPTGVSPYYMVLGDAKTALKKPNNLVAANGGAGALSAGTYYYKVTALDGAGGETDASNEASWTLGSTGAVTLTWNIVPNAYGYNVYRGTATGTEVLLIGTGLPMLQPNPLTATVSFTDTGIALSTITFTNVTAVASVVGVQNFIQFTLAGTQTFPSGVIVGLAVASSGFTPSTFNITGVIFSQLSANSIVVQGGPGSGTAEGVTVSIGPIAAGAGSNIVAGRTGAWVDPGNITVPDGSYAIVNLLTPGVFSQYLAATNLGITGIPVGATIVGIQMDILKSCGSTGADSVFDAGVLLLKAGALAAGCIDHSDGIPWPVDEAYTSYGGPTDTWGVVWTPADIMDPGFGGVTSAYSTGMPSPLIGAVDFIRITVWYKTGAGGTFMLTNTTTTSQPPAVDDTTQTALYRMPNGPIPVSYNSANIVAMFPASVLGFGVAPSGGSGGGGTTGPGTLRNVASTPSGGIPGLVSLIPQIVQFTNRLILALGNGYAIQMYSDATGTPTNPAFTGPITSVVTSGDQVTVTIDPAFLVLHPLTAHNLPVGSNVMLSAMTDDTYNGVFQVISVNIGAGTFIIRNPLASGGGATGTFTATTVPITNTFTPVFSNWVLHSQYAVNSVVQPTAPTPNNSYFAVVQAGTSGAVEPSWSTVDVLDQEIADGTILWKNKGPIQNAAPPPPGAGHITVYSGCLWVVNTSSSNTSTGIDGPCSLRMSDVNNPISWNPINQAFLDKDDGTEGMGLATFTISAEGIPPEGSLIVFKNYSGYQIVGIFGSSNFSIQRIRSDMGCFAPRSIWFVPGYGVARYAHLGVALFDGVRDTVISEEMRPYLFPSNDSTVADITVADSNWIPAAQGCLVANPPMYAFAIPIGSSKGALTRILNYDLVLKCWSSPVDLPFSISVMTQVRPVTSNPLTIFGGYSDGTLQRWQAGDTLWYTGDAAANTPVVWSVTTPEVFGNPQDQKLYWRRLAIRGVSNGATSLNVTPYVNGVAKPTQAYPIPILGDFEVFAGILREGLRFSALVSGAGNLEISRFDYQVMSKHIGVPAIVS